MAIIYCANCKRKLNVPDNWDRNATCNTCGSYFYDITSPSIAPKEPVPMNYYNPSGNLSNQFQEIGNTFQDIRQNIPHIMVGGHGINANSPRMPYNPQNNQPQTNPIPNKYYRFKQWILTFLVSLVVCYAAYKIILSFF